MKNKNICDCQGVDTTDLVKEENGKYIHILCKKPIFKSKIVRVITLYQPWATLLAYGIKINETRPKPTSHTAEKGIYLIHAAKKWTKKQRILCYTEPFKTELLKLHCFVDFPNLNCLDEIPVIALPLGQIIGLFEVKECLKVEESVLFKSFLNKKVTKDTRVCIKTPELHYGDYSEGRSVWIGQNHKVFENPIPYKGGQGYYQKFKGDINQLKFK